MELDLVSRNGKADILANEIGREKGIHYPVWGHTEIYLKTIYRYTDSKRRVF